MEIKTGDKQPLISIIVPIYGVEKYLATCIDSILAQTYQNIEVILVDDGSPDCCPQICDAYAEKYPEKIKVFHKKNGGLSDARNFGTNRANGEYVSFVDSDDYIKRDYIEYLFELLSKYDANISCAKLTCVSDMDNVKFDPVDVPNSDMVMTAPEALAYIYTRSEGVEVSACAKLYKRHIVLDNPFPEGRLFEDLATVCKFIIRGERISFGTKPVYCYCQRANSILHSVMSQKKLEDGIWAANEQLHYIQNYCTEASDIAHVRCAMKAAGFVIPAFLSGDNGKYYFEQARSYLKPHMRMVLSDRRRSILFKIKCMIIMLGYWPSRIAFYPFMLALRSKH